MFRLIFLSFLCFTCASVFSQQQTQSSRNPVPVSSSSNQVQLSALDVLLNNRSKADEEKMNRDILNYRQTNTEVITLPVVFHIVNQNPSSVTDQEIADALKDLNDAFAKAGSYSSSTGADTKIRFCLANTDPDGGRSTGITRTTSFFSQSLNPKIEDTRLKNLVQWDPTRYINIWHITSMELEILPQFLCGKWTRSKGAGYATLPPNAGATDGIVITSFKNVLIHEMGHYLGLYHTFEGVYCRNNDCSVDGDRVCDTPPDASVVAASSCTDPSNSCSSDTLSGFAVDVPDLIVNFMDYGNESCQKQFTEGQAQRMRAAIATQRFGLLQNQCAPPCLENITANFTRNNPYPTPGSAVTFTNTSSGAANFQWLINGVVVSATKDFTHTFNAQGKYKVTLKAYNSPSCFSTYTNYVIVNCGVTSRFYTDKSTVGSKSIGYTDTVNFINTSENATSFKWIMSNDKGMGEQVVSTAANLSYVFTTPANYLVKLIAYNGNCIDTTLSFPIVVIDPTPDGIINLYSAECVDQTKIKLSISTCNYGYITIPPNVPVTFYDAEPRLPTAKKITTIFLPDSIKGNCCSNYYSYTIDIGRSKLNTLYAVFNDNGSSVPIALPNTSVLEKDYNNISSITNVAFVNSTSPKQAILEPGDTIQLSARAGPGIVNSYVWSSPKDLSCTTCQSPTLIADSSIIKSVIATSNRGCSDTAYVDIKVPPYNDYRVSLNDVQCAGKDSLYVNFTIFNDFKRPVLPATLTVSFYSGNPLTGNATFLGPVFSLTDTIVAKQFTFSTFIKGISSGNIYAVVNDAGKVLPISFPNTFLLEKDYTNNTAVSFYKPETISIQPSDTTVLRKDIVPLTISGTIFDPASTIWSIGDGYNLSCITCPKAIAKPFDSSIVIAHTANRFGCLLKGTAAVNVFPPDMQVKITDTKCYSDNTALVTFSICMNNNYDSVYANIPVSFYDGNPVNGAPLLQPVFYTPRLQAGRCYTYTTKVAAPLTNKIYAVVNDKGRGNNGVPTKMYNETNYTNNIADSIYTPFRVKISPSDTFIQRLTSIRLTPEAQGGTLTSYLWKPAQSISCTNCATPMVTPPYTMRYELTAKNENFCTDTAIAIVKTHTLKEVFIPDAFTPNNDQLNDILYVFAGPDATLIKEFTIFNRWGQKIFQVQNVVPNNPTLGWNGKVNGQDAAAGTYVYFVTMAFADGSLGTYKGTIVLIR